MKEDLFTIVFDALVLFSVISRLSEHCVQAAPLDTKAILRDLPGGLVLEFGVANGTSIREIAETIPERMVYGFDSFEGLPEPWAFHPQGLFKQHEMPKVPPNVVLVKGVFQDTLKNFLFEHAHDKVAFVHIDCDLYSSTKFVLNSLKDRFFNGSVILFDEILMLPKNIKHEARAFIEFCEENGFSFVCIGRHNDKAAFAIAPPPRSDVDAEFAIGRGNAPLEAA